MKISAFLILLIPFFLFAQESRIDSLKSVLLTIKSDSARVITLYGLAIEHNVNSPDTALQLIDEAIQLSEKLNYPSGLAMGYYWLGRTYTVSGNYQKAFESYYTSLEYYEGLVNLAGQADVYYGLAKLLYKDDPVLTLEYVKKYYNLSKSISDSVRMFDALSAIGAVYFYLEDNDNKDMEYYLKAMSLYDRLNIKKMIFSDQGAQRFNIEYLQLAYSTLLNNHNAYIIANVGKAYAGKGNWQKAKEYTSQAYEIATKQGSPDNIAYVAEFYKDVLIELGDYEKAYEVFALYIQMRDSINIKEVEQAVLEKEMTHEHEKELLALSKEQEKKEAVTRLIIISVSGGLVVLVVFLFLLYRKTQRIRRSKAALQVEKDRSENLLLNILPADIAAELKENGEAAARDFERVSILFTDFKEFTQISEKLSAAELVAEINYCFKGFDEITEKYGIEKIKTIGDAYMATGGLPIPTNDSARNTVLAAIEMQRFISHRKSENNAQSKLAFEMRLGIHTGPVVAGIVGVKKFQYDVWGDTVNTASRMESAGEVGQVNISHYTYELIKDDTNFTFNKREKIEVKGKGEMDMYFVTPMES